MQQLWVAFCYSGSWVSGLKTFAHPIWGGGCFFSVLLGKQMHLRTFRLAGVACAPPSAAPAAKTPKSKETNKILVTTTKPVQTSMDQSQIITDIDWCLPFSKVAVRHKSDIRTNALFPFLLFPLSGYLASLTLLVAADMTLPPFHIKGIVCWKVWFDSFTTQHVTFLEFSVEEATRFDLKGQWWQNVLGRGKKKSSI